MTTNTITHAGTLSTSSYTLAGTGVTGINAGTIKNSAGLGAIYIAGTRDVLSNTGSIVGASGGGGAVYVKATSSGASITNHSGAVIEGSGSTHEVDGIFSKATATIANYGLILGTGVTTTNGIIFSGGTGYVTNFSTGTISAGGVWMGGTGTVVNQGQIIGDSFYGGVYLTSGGQISNQSGGIISAGGGGYGVKIDAGAGTITNAGTITSGSTSGSAVILAAGATNRVIVDPTGVFIGTVDGGSAPDATLELASGASAGTISNLGSFTNFGTLQFDVGENWLVSGSSTGLLSSATIASFAAGDTLAIAGTESISHSASSGGLTKVTLTGSSTMTLTFAGTISGFQANVAGGVTDLTTLCFCAGTRIRTPDGDIPVEQLAVGDEVVTWSGRTRRLIWIGDGKVLATRGQRSAATPVIVQRGAIADEMPDRDLHVTKGHSFYLDGVLIPVEFLVNYRSIIWDDHAQEVELYHLELETHDVLIANGAPAESYRDDGNRRLFRNANDGWNLPPKKPYARVLTGGPIVDAVWHRLLDRTGLRPNRLLTSDPDLHLVVDGKPVAARTWHAGHYVFALENRPRVASIMSRTAVPAELGSTRDFRCLGVAINRLMLRQGIRTRSVEANDRRLADGFHPFEKREGFRWTSGESRVPVSLFADFRGPMELVLTVVSTTQYIDDGKARMVA